MMDEKVIIYTCTLWLQLLDELFEKAELACSWACLAPDVLTKLLIPSAVWRASKVLTSAAYGNHN